MPDSLTPKQLHALFERGNNFMRVGNLKSAAQDYTTVLVHQPQFAPAYYNRGFARQHGLGEVDEAIEDYSAAIHYQPDFPQAYINRAIAYTQREQVELAIGDYSAALTLKPDLSQAYVNRGELYIQQADYAAAVADFRAALALKSGYRYALAGLAVGLLGLEALDEAQSIWRGLLERNPNFANADWVREELGWHDILVEGAAALIATLNTP